MARPHRRSRYLPLLLLGPLVALPSAALSSMSGRESIPPLLLRETDSSHREIAWISAAEADRLLGVGRGLDLRRSLPEVTTPDVAPLESSGNHALDAFQLILRHSIKASYAANGCIRLDSAGCSWTQDSLQDLLETADYILTGKVVETAAGFLSSAGTLLEIETTEILKTTAPSLTARDRVLAFYPAAIFEFAGLEICAQNDNYPPPPSVGDEILLVAHSMQNARIASFAEILVPTNGLVSYKTEERVMLTRQLEELFSVGSSGEVNVATIKSGSVPSLAYLVRRIRAELDANAVPSSGEADR